MGRRSRTKGGRESWPREYTAWAKAKNRCRSPKAEAWANYGGRGIKFSPAWDRFVDFLRDMGPCPLGYSLERRDNNGDYAPGNCAWIPRKKQALNRRNSRKLTLDSATLNLSEWARKLNCAVSTIRHRVDSYGWSVRQALTTPIRPKSDSRWSRGTPLS